MSLTSIARSIALLSALTLPIGAADCIFVCCIRTNLATNLQVTATTAGTTIVPSRNYRRVVINPSSLLASVTVSFPSDPIDGDELLVFVGGTLSSGTVVTAYSTTNATIIQSSLPSYLVAGDFIHYEYNSGASVWFRKH